MKTKQKLIGMIIIALSLFLTIIGYITLPETLTVQISFGGTPSNMLPKLLGLLIPLVISCFFSVLYILSSGREKNKNLIISIVGIAIFIFIFIVNL